MLNLESVRQKFPALNQNVGGGTPIFLDGPGGTQVPKAVLDAMVAYLGTSNSNLLESSFFAVKRTQNIVELARKNAAELINCTEDEVVFGANMTSLTAHMSRSIAQEWREGDEIIVTDLDHFANVSFWVQEAQNRGVKVHVVPVKPEGCTLNYDYLERFISPKTKLVAFTLASNICGSRADAQRVISGARSVGAMTYVDAVHYTPHEKPDVKALGCDFLVCSAYKFFGPHLGVLYGKAERLRCLKPYKVLPASNHIPDRWETGTKSFEALAGFNATIDYMRSLSDSGTLQDSYDLIHAHETTWTKAFIERARRISALTVHGITDDLQMRTPTFALTLQNHEPQAFSEHLARHNIAAGASHFYATGVTDTLGLTDNGGVVRIGALHYNTIAEMDYLFEIIEDLL